MNDRNDIGFTPLHKAADARDLESVRLLVGRGADINAADKLGNTPLDCADHVIGGHDVAQFLRQQGARSGVAPK